MLTDVYLLPNAEGTAFKIGVAADTRSRMAGIGARFDDTHAVCFGFPSRDAAFSVESRLHRVFKPYRLEHHPGRSGNTEWFEIGLYPVAREFLRQFAVELGVERVQGLVPALNLEDAAPSHSNSYAEWAAAQKFSAADYTCSSANAVERLFVQGLADSRQMLGRDAFYDLRLLDQRFLVMDCTSEEAESIKPFFHTFQPNYRGTTSVKHRAVARGMAVHLTPAQKARQTYEAEGADAWVDPTAPYQIWRILTPHVVVSGFKRGVPDPTALAAYLWARRGLAWVSMNRLTKSFISEDDLRYEIERSAQYEDAPLGA